MLTTVRARSSAFGTDLATISLSSAPERRRSKHGARTEGPGLGPLAVLGVRRRTGGSSRLHHRVPCAAHQGQAIAVTKRGPSQRAGVTCGSAPGVLREQAPRPRPTRHLFLRNAQEGPIPDVLGAAAGPCHSGAHVGLPRLPPARGRCRCTTSARRRPEAPRRDPRRHAARRPAPGAASGSRRAVKSATAVAIWRIGIRERPHGSAYRSVSAAARSRRLVPVALCL